MKVGDSMPNHKMFVKEAAALWGVSERRVTTLCKDGKIEGAIKDGNKWIIPSNATKPEDTRVKTGKYKKVEERERLPLPVGISDFQKACTEYYYVDKTLMIKDFIDERPMVSLFTRPRRFGKTLNMDMLRTFFEISEKDTSIYFKDKKIWDCGEKYRSYQGKYPVIFITFKDIKHNSWEKTYEAIKEVFSKEARRHIELKTSPYCNSYEKENFEKLLSGSVTEIGLSNALLDLSLMLHKHYGIAPIIIIDEYDIPIGQGYTYHFYDEVITFMRNLFSGGLKDNPHLSYGFLTGILRVAKESVFSGLNNLVIHSVLDKKYSQYFGFTPQEVRQMLSYYQVANHFNHVCEWYDGYRFGNTEIFNPWSVVNYVSNGCEARPYWQSTGSNDIIGEIISSANQEIYQQLHSLVNGESIVAYIDTGVIYPQIIQNPSSIYSFLLVTGYLKVLNSSVAFNGDYMCELALPNREISFVYRNEILDQLNKILPKSIAISIQEAIFSKNYLKLKTVIQKLLIESVSYFDTIGENFYHGLMLGLCAVMKDSFITSNRESGNGRYDLQLMPLKKGMPGIIIELKATKDPSDEKLRQLADEAYEQIVENKYDEEMIALGIEPIYKYGVAFSGKQVEVRVG